MAYEVFFRDKTSTIVDTGDGERLKELLLKQKTASNIEINGEMYRSSEIISIKHATAPTVPLADWNSPVLAEGKKCRGQYSIQQEITKITLSQHPKDWAKYIGNKEWREGVRLKLRETTDQWCDSRLGKCVCD